MFIDPVTKMQAVMCIVFNIIFFFPVGTFIHACLSKNGCISLLVGFLTTFLLLIKGVTEYAYALSIMYGIFILIVSKYHEVH